MDIIVRRSRCSIAESGSPTRKYSHDRSRSKKRPKENDAALRKNISLKQFSLDIDS